MRQRFSSNSKEIIVPFLPDINLKDVEFTIPKIGDKKKLLSLSEKNVKQYKIDKLKKSEMLNPKYSRYESGCCMCCFQKCKTFK